MLAASVIDPAPFMTFEMDAARYYSFLSDAMLAGRGGELESMPELQKASQEMLDAVAKSVSRMSMSVDFTEHGIEFNSTVDLAQ